VQAHAPRSGLRVWRAPARRQRPSAQRKRSNLPPDSVEAPRGVYGLRLGTVPQPNCPPAEAFCRPYRTKATPLNRQPSSHAHIDQRPQQRPAGILLGKGPTSRAPISMLFTQSGVASCLHHGPSASDDRPATTCRSPAQTRSASNSYQGLPQRVSQPGASSRGPGTAPQQRLGRRGPRIIHQQQLVFFCAAPRLVGRAPHAFRRAGLDTGSNTHPNPPPTL
jgi:hypothetical protein